MPPTGRKRAKRSQDRPARKRVSAEPPGTDPVEAAEAAGLTYVSDAAPGITRRRAGKGFRYIGPTGAAVRDAATLARMRSLAVPPAYTDVWISPDPRGHIQATGRDARGRKQYRYHQKWREVRDETKFGRMLAFSEALPGLRERVEADLSLPGLTRQKVLAAVVSLLESTCIRVGNDEYARSNKSFGLTTLQDRHVKFSGGNMTFSFRGKSGKKHECKVSDRRLARIVQHCQALSGEELFQYMDDAGERQTIGSGDVNGYLRDMTGQEFTAKDFRTWAGTMLAATHLRDIGTGKSVKESKSNILKAVDEVSSRLNNTRAVSRKYYVHPAILEAYAAGTLHDLLTAGNGKRSVADATFKQLKTEEQAVVRLLRMQLNAVKATPAS
ncbi:MAG: DNA topoisomerase IB [Gemmatimonadales bacterium]|nr:DNA topoisomerase IB [Gemmatimonadales bacterium]